VAKWFLHYKLNYLEFVQKTQILIF
jgi:hypothetical protein